MFPKIISIGSFFLPTYGLMVALGFLVALWLAGRLAKQTGLDPEAVTNLGVYAALAGFVGAKLLMFIVEFDRYAKDPGEIFSFATLQAGGVFYGGLVLALAFGYWYGRQKKLPLGKTLDVLAPGLAIGQAIGRIGCFAAGCCWGAHCDRPWAVTFTNPDAHQITGVPLGIPLHPSQLYESALLVLVFAIVYGASQKPHRPGGVISLYLVTSSVARFIAEFFREHQQANLFGWVLSNAQWISVGLFVLGGVLLLRGAPRGGALIQGGESR
ncbi:MAG: prolipoprotein diacylglyceryl transferase [Bryobacteraceae bacterium]